MNKILDFKTVVPLFEKEKYGAKPLTIRQVDNKDKRFRALAQWNRDCNWALRITNPDTGESFIRRIKSVSYLVYHDWSVPPVPVLGQLRIDYDWRIILLGELTTSAIDKS